MSGFRKDTLRANGNKFNNNKPTTRSIFIDGRVYIFAITADNKVGLLYS